jgi:hypothetical protein
MLPVLFAFLALYGADAAFSSASTCAETDSATMLQTKTRVETDGISDPSWFTSSTSGDSVLDMSASSSLSSFEQDEIAASASMAQLNAQEAGAELVATKEEYTEGVREMVHSAMHGRRKSASATSRTKPAAKLPPSPLYSPLSPTPTISRAKSAYQLVERRAKTGVKPMRHAKHAKAAEKSSKFLKSAVQAAIQTAVAAALRSQNGSSGSHPAPAPPQKSMLPENLIGEGNSSSGNKSDGLNQVAPTDPPFEMQATPAPPPYGHVTDPKPETMLQPLNSSSQSSNHSQASQDDIPTIRDCLVEEWTEWTDCNFMEGDLYQSPRQSRERVIINQQQPGGQACPEPLSEARLCEED